MKRLPSLALCILLAVFLGYTKTSAAGRSDNEKNGVAKASLTVMSNESRFAAGSASTLLNRTVVIVLDTVDCVVPLHSKASFSVTAQGEQLRYQWQMRDPKTDLWVGVSEQYVGKCSGSTDSTFSFMADTYTNNGMMFRCVVTDMYGNTAVSSPAALRITANGAEMLNAIDFGADGTDGRDDSAAIQAAFDFAEQYADEKHPITVSLPDGHYDVAHTLYISSHIRFILSDGAELNYRGDNGCMLQGGRINITEDIENGISERVEDYKSLIDVTICGGRWNAGASAGDVLTSPIIMINASDIHLCHLDMRQSSCHDIMLASADNVVISGCTFHDSVTVGEETPHSREAVFIGYVWNEFGKVMMSRNVTVNQCVFDGVNGGVGVRCQDAANQSLHVTVEKCVFRSLSASCVNADGVIGLTVSNCRASDCGAFLYAYRTGGNVTSNMIEGTGERCMMLTGGSVVNITDNRIAKVGQCDVPARVESYGVGMEQVLFTSNTEWQMITGTFLRLNDRTVRYVSGAMTRMIVNLNEWGIGSSSDHSQSGGSSIAVYYRDSMGSVTGNTVTDVEGRGIFVEDSTSLTVISDNDFRGVSGTDVSAFGSKVAVLSNRFDNPAKSVVIDPLSADSVTQEVYNQNDSRLSSPVVVMQSDSVQTSAKEMMGFSVAAQGSGLKYQWYYKPHDSCFWSVWKGHTSPTAEAIASYFWNGMQVCCVITDRDGKHVSTKPIRVTLRRRIPLTLQPPKVKWKVDDEASVWADGFAYGNDQWIAHLQNHVTWPKWKMQTQSHLSAWVAEDWEGLEAYNKVGTYYQAVKNTLIAADSVIPSLGFLSQPQSMTVNCGDPVSFSVGTYGVDVRYRWYYRTSSTDRWELWSDQAGSQAQTTADERWNGREVRCFIYDSYGQYATSRAAKVTVKGTGMEIVLSGKHDEGLRIVSQPEDVIVREGEVPTVSIEVSGSDLRCQWYLQKTTDEPWQRLIGYRTSSVDLPLELVRSGAWVRCEVKDGKGRMVVSEPARVNVLDNLVVVKQPENLNVKPGENAVFSFKALGAELHYQWYRRMPGDRCWSVWKGHTAPSFSEAADVSWNGMEVCCVATDSYGTQTASPTAYVIVDDGPMVTEQPQSVSVPAGGKITFSVNAKGDNVTCQWYYRRSENKEWVLWEDKTEWQISAIANTAWNGMQVRCVLTDKWGHSTVSQTATVSLQ